MRVGCVVDEPYGDDMLDDCCTGSSSLIRETEFGLSAFSDVIVTSFVFHHCRACLRCQDPPVSRWERFPVACIRSLAGPTMFRRGPRQVIDPPADSFMFATPGSLVQPGAHPY